MSKLALLFAILLAAQNYDYVTLEEEDLIRDAQGLELRVPAFLRLLDNRIVALGLRTRTPKEREQTKKDIAGWEARKKEADRLKIPDVEMPAKPLNPDVYLRNTTRSELLRGYIQIVEETLDNIEDAHERKLDVRVHVESLQKFVAEQLPRIKTLEAKTPSETSALRDAIRHSENTLADIREALKQLPKTEKK